MGVYIKGMGMPKSCVTCRLECLYRIHSSSARSEYCPLIEIAEPKDEPQTCDTCKHKGEYAYCRLCGRLSENNYEPKDEPQTEREGE